MPKRIEAYECEYCKKKVTRTKGGMKQHEKKCFWNPESKSCMTCENFITGGHYPSQCKHKEMNKVEEYADSKMRRHIKHLQTNCNLYKFDELTFEERKQIILENDLDAQADHDDYNANRM